MMTYDDKAGAGSRHLPDALVLPLSALDSSLLPLVGGKAARLGELTRADFAVPPGFCITTAVYVQLSARAELEPLLEALAQLGHRDSTQQAELAARIRAALLKTPLPTATVEAITAAYHALGTREPAAVAVRSSATAEDLPAASFAGQQDTLLNVRGTQAVLLAVQHCFASLWTERAVGYRAEQGIDPRHVRLAVVVQLMLEASVAGVLFTANPLTGKRTESVLEANPGLGEAVVSGATNPDHFVVKTASGEIVERRLGDKRIIIQAAPEGGRAGSKPMHLLKLVSLTLKSRNSFAWERRSRRSLALPRISNGPLTAQARSSCFRRAPSRRSFHSPLERRLARRPCASTSHLVSSKASTDPSRRWASPHSV